MSKLFLTLLLFIATGTISQTIKSPADFLGYTLGTTYTRHHKVVEYFEYVAKTAANNVKLTQYGTTNEGRPLYVAFVSNEKNMANIETIRLQNLSRAKLATNTITDNTAIVWLSYNVHGNEPSSSEAAMQTLYELVTKQDKGWLANTLVIIDPCLNPDGRDRYVNWYNGMVGKTPNSNPNSREHLEPWPGGRVNHYYFDLNRDWAWQTQVETQQRIKVYNQWLPHIHVDFHEQGFNEPYYFAPAAEPMHEVITPWQRDFQTTIGKNHAKYFDANGWYYFTKERFDLFYPSYGDTYPTYNGSIGMTYEQGGHSRGGLTVQQDNGELLTLVDRVQHHHTTGMSTVEVASQNAKALLDNFSNYFASSNNAVGSNYKTYILTSNSKNKLNEVSSLLAANGISYTKTTTINGTGYNYASQKVEPIKLDKYSIAVSAYQPKSLLAKVLLEPQSKLSDTATYDITAWSLPYAYGVNAYASTEKLQTATEKNDNTTILGSTEYAYFVRYSAVTDAKLFAQLLKQGTKIYVNEKEITQQGNVFERGTLIIPKKENNNNWKNIVALLAASGADATVVNTGFAQKGPDLGSPDIKFIHPPKIATIMGNETSATAAGLLWSFFDNELQYATTQFNAEQLRLSTIKNYDVLIMPDGYYKALSDKSTLDDLKTWLRLGGRLIVIEGAAAQLAAADWALKLKKGEEKADDKKSADYAELKEYEKRDRDDITNYIPGAIYEVDLDNTHPLGFGFGKKYYTLKQNSDVLEFAKDGWNIGTIKKNKKVSGFAGKKVLDKLQDGTVIAVQQIGSGSVIYFTDDPMFRSFWQGGKMLLFNAAFLVGNNAVRL